jgi:hypothetical protein
MFSPPNVNLVQSNIMQRVKLPKSFLAVNLSESHTFHKKVDADEKTNEEFTIEGSLGVVPPPQTDPSREASPILPEGTREIEVPTSSQNEQTSEVAEPHTSDQADNASIS